MALSNVMTFYRKWIGGGSKSAPGTKKVSTPRQKRIKAILRTSAFVGGGLLIIGFFAFTLFAAWVSRDLPDPNALSTRDIPQSTKIYDRTGTVLLYEIHGDEKRTLVKVEDIPDYAKEATVSIEDKRFYEHNGIDWVGLGRAVVMSVVKGQRIQGTSTLTQQLVKNAVLTNERSVMRKVKEFLLALQIERRFSKDQILQLYFNEIPYGSTIYGIESASQTYLGKRAKDLTLDEAALLAAIPQRPDYYSPYGTGSSGDNRERLVVRQHYILDLMAEQNYITKDQAESAKQVDTLKKIKPHNLGEIKAPHFVMYVKSLLTEQYGQKTVEQGGLKVTTTLDWDKEQAAEDEVAKGVEARGKQYSFTNAALVSLDPKTGQVLAMVGSKDFFDAEHDGQVNVTLRERQPGSSFKPIVYAVGFMRGYLPETQLWDVNTTFKTDLRDYQPHNYDGKERGPVSIRQALQGSLNTPAVKMLYLVGVGRVLDFAESLGYTTFGDRSRFGLSLVLGGGEVKPIEHANAFAAFANDGTQFPTSAILKVEESSGKVLQEWSQPEGKSVMDPQIARTVSGVLSDNVARTYVFGASNSLTLPDRPVAAKTGTTNNFHDAWTVGYTPNLVTAVWVGNNDNAEMKRGADGSIIAAPIWQGYMKRATKGKPVERFQTPASPSTTKLALLGKVTQQKVKIDTVSGKRATDYTPPDFVQEVDVYEAHDILYYVDKDDPTGPAPANPASDPQYINWETAVQAWVQKTQWHTTNTAPLLYDDVHVPQNQPQVTISSPMANQTIDTRFLTIQSTVASIRPIARLEVALNGQPVGSTSGAPFSFQLHIPNAIEKGFHDLTVTAIDDVGNRGQATVIVNLTAERDTLGGVTLNEPSNETVWSRASFPKSVVVTLTDPSLYRRVDVSFVGTDGLRRLVGSEILPTNPTSRLSVPAGPPTGRYAVIVEAFLKEGDAKDTAQVFVTVTE